MPDSEPGQPDRSPPLDPNDPAEQSTPTAAPSDQPIDEDEALCAIGPPDVPPLAGTLTAWMVLAALFIAAAAGLPDRAVLTDHDRSILPGVAAVIEPLPDYRIDPNVASEAELRLLPAIGPVLAGNIVASREQDGPFRTAEDLNRVHRIGPKTVAKLRPYVDLPSAAPVLASPERELPHPPPSPRPGG